MFQRTRINWLMNDKGKALIIAMVVLLSLLAAACATLRGVVHTEREDRGIRLAHEKHAKEELDCTTCHDTSKGEPAMPDHDMCSTCHDFDVDKPTPEACGFCHTAEDYSVTPRTPILSSEVKFTHAPHIAKELECGVCHPAPDQSTLPKGQLMPFCMDCHAKQDPKLVECAMCHTELSKDVRPKYRGKVRIAHDAPEAWEKIHGQQSKLDPAFCAICHEDETSCEECHRTNPPSDHTVSWRRKSHGLRAGWDREKCSVCHEEDSCIKCHSNTAPSSHSAGWGRLRNRHCVTCHYPAEKTNCTVCHESIPHTGALPSPHTIGVFPPNCRLCHPGGNPFRAPHLLNSTARCVVCH